MKRYITNPKDYTADQLRNYDWDIIELDWTFDASKMMEWFNQMNEEFGHCRFYMKDEYFKKYFAPEYIKRYKVFEYSIPNEKGEYPYHYTLQWVTERYEPLPFPHIADLTKFPEIEDENFDEFTDNLLEKFRFGALKELEEVIGYSFQKVRAMVIPSGVAVAAHHDVEPGDFMFKLHMQLDVNDDCTWYFGYSGEREYSNLKTGKAYIMNTSNIHGVNNTGNTDWYIFYNCPFDEPLNKLLQLSGKIT